MLKNRKVFLTYNNMIKEKELNINIVSRNLKYYNDLGYACHLGEKISINITDIPKKSHIKVTAICDHCGKETTISNQKYNENFEKYNLYTCKKCCQIKIKLTNNEKYGVDYPLQNVNIYNKLKETNIYKYGVENVFQNIEIKNKIKSTNIINYDVEYPQQNLKILKKSNETNNKKYGCDRPAQNELIYNKIKNTKKLKYDDEFFNNINKSRNTIFEKYGIINISQLLTHKDLIHSYFTDKMLLKYNFIKDIDYNKREYVCECDKGHIYKIKTKLFHNRLSHNINTCTICYPENALSSEKEIQLLNFIKQHYDGLIIENDRKILNGRELDIYLPDLNIAFEYNGLYWHSNIYKNDNYHLNKMLDCLHKDIQLIHIWEDDWLYNSDLIKERIINVLNNDINIDQLEIEPFYLTDKILETYTIIDIIEPIKWNIVGNKRIPYNIDSNLPHISDCGKIILKYDK